MTDKERIFHLLDDLGIRYDHAVHAPMFHMEDCRMITDPMDAAICKNFFLTTKSRKVFCLCITRPNARLRTADISKQAGTPRLTFADEEDMVRLLHVHPGAVSPMGLLFDDACQVRLLVDSALPTIPKLAFHPCDNSETLAMSSADFFDRFLPAVRHAPLFVEIHDFE